MMIWRLLAPIVAVLALVAVVVVLCVAKFKYQEAVWADEASIIYTRQIEKLNSLPFDALLSRLGQPHEKHTYVVKGHKFMVGWMVALPGTVGSIVKDTPPRVPPTPSAAIEEVEVLGYVDFIYPLPFTEYLHLGWSMRLVRSRTADR